MAYCAVSGGDQWGGHWMRPDKNCKSAAPTGWSGWGAKVCIYGNSLGELASCALKALVLFTKFERFIGKINGSVNREGLEFISRSSFYKKKNAVHVEANLIKFFLCSSCVDLIQKHNCNWGISSAVLFYTDTTWLVLLFTALIMYYTDIRKRSSFAVYNDALVCQFALITPLHGYSDGVPDETLPRSSGFVSPIHLVKSPHKAFGKGRQNFIFKRTNQIFYC